MSIRCDMGEREERRERLRAFFWDHNPSKNPNPKIPEYTDDDIGCIYTDFDYHKGNAETEKRILPSGISAIKSATQALIEKHTQLSRIDGISKHTEAFLRSQQKSITEEIDNLIDMEKRLQVMLKEATDSYHRYERAIKSICDIAGKPRIFE